MSSRWWGHYQFGNEIVLKHKCADFVRWRYFMKEEVGIQDSVSFHSHSPLLDPNPDVFYQILTRRGICSWNLMLMFSSISGLRDGKLEDSTHLTLVEKLTGDRSSLYVYFLKASSTTTPPHTAFTQLYSTTCSSWTAHMPLCLHTCWPLCLKQASPHPSFSLLWTVSSSTSFRMPELSPVLLPLDLDAPLPSALISFLAHLHNDTYQLVL